ncbi:MAG TPA: metal ABC transporter substrate-binding protein [Burkholderiales bacterium]|nr:metal ABC transporter substrate-binding protein [Burkholderiales bacterium]
MPGLRAAAAFGLVVALAGVSHAALPVVATSTDLKALVEEVGRDGVEVESLAPPAQDPHAIEIKPGQIARLKRAALLFRVGLDHEPWLARALAAAGEARFAPGAPASIDASRGVRLLQTETPRLRAERGVHLHGLGNTHYWLDPNNARPITATILEALARERPAERGHFEANRRRFLERLDAGIARWSTALAPHRGTRVVVVHETWPYFADHFGLAIVAAVEPVPGVPPSPATLSALTERMRAAGVRLLIAEPYSNASVVRQVAERSGARVVTLVPSVGADPAASDYLALFDLNVKRLAQALGAR